MIALPRYAVAPPTFRFRAALAVADRLPLGGEREVALATWLCARLLWDLADPTAFEPDALRARATALRQWGQAMALPVPARQAVTQVTDAAARGDREGALAAWHRLLAQASRAIEAALRTERKSLEDRLAAPPHA